MNILLDTHIALWAITDSPKLPKLAREAIENISTQIWISSASLWEIAIKHSLGRGDMPISSEAAWRYFQLSGYQLLATKAEHAVAVETLPAHHQDPFDRILIAQALIEPMRLMTHDALVAKYNDTIMYV